jgi:hypothetical protein
MRHYSPAALAGIVSLRKLQHAVAQTAVAVAMQEERQARATEQDAVRERDAALGRWHDQLRGTAFSPEMATGFASVFGETEMQARLAGEQVERSNAARRDCEDRWHESDARCRQAGSMLAGSRRRETRAREERALLAIADRVAFTWRRR